MGAKWFALFASRVSNISESNYVFEVEKKGMISNASLIEFILRLQSHVLNAILNFQLLLKNVLYSIKLDLIL